MLHSLLLSALSAPSADLVTSLPGFNVSSAPFKVYSGHLSVPGPFELTDYDKLEIHYQLHTAQSGDDAPVATWHQGGPGGSSIDVGLYTEMGYFQISHEGTYTNPYAWNRVAHMLYLESPAGSGQSNGFSSCHKGGRQVPCKWDDVSQAEAYAHSLLAFFKAFPEYGKNELYLTGESYFGQYGPNIANYILNHAQFNSTLNLVGIAAGNACWGGDDDTVKCNGPNVERNDLELFHGKGMVSRKLYDATNAACSWGEAEESASCKELMNKVHDAVGPHNIYNLYDNCQGAARAAQLGGADGMTARQIKQHLREQMLPGSAPAEAAPQPAETARQSLAPIGAPSGDVAKVGGYTWSCGGMEAAEAWITSAEVREALHLRPRGSGSRFSYKLSGPASVTLWPFLASKLRILIYNGDADACVPYVGNEEWIDGLEAKGVLGEQEPWRPWYTTPGTAPPAGYATKYRVADAPGKDFSFVTIRLAGHMVPTFQPAAGFAMIERFLGKKPF